MTTTISEMRASPATSQPATTNALDITASAQMGQPSPAIKLEAPTPGHHPEFSDRGMGAGGGKRSHPEGGCGLKKIENTKSGPKPPAGADDRHFWRPVRIDEIVGSVLTEILVAGGRP